MKICHTCLEEKEESDFYKQNKNGLTPDCKRCHYKLVRSRFKYDPEKARKSYLRFKESNPEALRRSRNKSVSKWREANREKDRKNSLKWSKNNPVKARARHKNWRDSNKEHLRKYYSNYHKNRNKVDTMFRISKSMRSRMAPFKKTLSNNTSKILGCSKAEFEIHIQRQFLPGMHWNNYGVNGWHVDHKFPLAKCKTIEELIRALHYTNCQPLWAKDNLSKNAKVFFELP